MNSTAALHAIQPYVPHQDVLYSLDEAAHLAGLPRHFVVVCLKHGLVSARIDATYGGLFFDFAALRGLQRIGYLHGSCGVNLTGIRIILELMDEVDRLKRETPMADVY